MKIRIEKKSPFASVYHISRSNGSTESFELDTKTYFIHDICHFVVESNLAYEKGFWGMLAQGHSFSSLFGKENVKTEELRFIENIVGPVQSVYQGFMSIENFQTSIAHLNYNVDARLLQQCLIEIKSIAEKWRSLTQGHSILLEWRL